MIDIGLRHFLGGDLQLSFSISLRLCVDKIIAIYLYLFHAIFLVYL